MADQRIKGQDTSLIFIQDNIPLANVMDVKNFEANLKFDILEEGYIGETSDRYDEIYKGVDEILELNFENSSIFDLFVAVRDRARRRIPGTQFNVKTTLNFPNGQLVRFILQNVFFGPMPIGFGSRSDYGHVKLSYACGDFGKL